jgi:hypothetical protein
MNSQLFVLYNLVDTLIFVHVVQKSENYWTIRAQDRD